MIRTLTALLLLWAAFMKMALADDAVLAAGRARSEAFLRGDVSEIWDAMTPEMRDALGDQDALLQLRTKAERAFGSENTVLREKVQRQNGYDVYLRVARWTRSTAPMRMQWTFDQDMKIAGFFARQMPALSESRFLDYQTKASLRLPFDGEWLVFWGGRTLEENYHAANKAQRFATDFLISKDGATHSGDAQDLRSYYCWDRPILAPAAGAVAVAVDGLPDQTIGAIDRERPAGNHVVLDLGTGEFAFLAHLRQASVTVKRGDEVASGQVLGRCGNSGNSSEPHLHFHLQTTPDLATGEGLPAFFENYVADGTFVNRGEPLQGQVVSPSDAR